MLDPKDSIIADIQESAPIPELDSDTQLLQELIKSNDWLMEAVMDLSNSIKSGSMTHAAGLMPAGFENINRDQAFQSAQETRDAKELAETIPGYLTPEERQEVDRNYQETEQAYQSHVSRMQTLLQQAQSHAQQLFQTVGSAGGEIFVAGADALGDIGSGLGKNIKGVQDDAIRRSQQGFTQAAGDEAGHIFAFLIPSVFNVTTKLAGMAGSLVGLGTAAAGLTTAVGALGAIGLAEVFAQMEDFKKYRTNLLQNSPNALGTADFLGDGAMSLGAFRTTLATELASTRSEEDVQKLLDAVISTRLPEGTSGLEVQNSATVLGLMNDVGVSPQKGASAIKNMVHNLRMELPEANFALMSLGQTARMHNLDLGAYIEKVIATTQALRGFGVTVAQVDQIYNQYGSMTMANGKHLSMDEAFGATQMELGMLGSMSMGQAAYLAQSANYATDPSIAFGGSGQNLSSMAQQGPWGTWMAAHYMKAGSPEDAFLHTAQTYRGISQNMLPAQFKDNKDAQRMMLGEVLKQQGLLQGDINDPKVAAVLEKILNTKDGEKASGAFKKELGKLIPKPLPDLLKELRETFGSGLLKNQEEVADQVNRFKSFAELWRSIRDMLFGVMYPIVREGMAVLVGVGNFIKTYADTQDLGKSLDSYSTAVSDTKAQWDMMLKESGLSELVENSPVWKEIKENCNIPELGKVAFMDFLNVNKIYKTTSDAGLVMLTGVNVSSYTNASSLKTSDGESLFQVNKSGFNNLSFHADSWQRKHGLLATHGQLGFLQSLDSSGQHAGVTGLYAPANTSHQSHHDGEAVDVGFAGMSQNEKIKMAQWLAGHPLVEKVGVAGSTGLSKYLGQKHWELSDHTDHFHIVLRKDSSELARGESGKNVIQTAQNTDLYRGVSSLIKSGSDVLNLKWDINLGGPQSQAKPKAIRKVNSKKLNKGVAG